MLRILLFLSFLIGIHHKNKAQEGWINQTPVFGEFCGFDTNNAWVVASKERSNTTSSGSSNGLYHTTDGGTTWNFTRMAGFSNLSNPQFLSANVGYVKAFSNNVFYLRQTTDGGSNWENIFSNFGNFYFLSPSVGWVNVGSDLKKTTDGGVTWITVGTLPSGLDYNSGVNYSPQFRLTFKFYSQTNGWLLADNSNHTASSVYTTTDGGQTWVMKLTMQTNPIFNYVRFSSLELLSNNEAWVAKGDSMLHTTNGGGSWTALKHPNASPTFNTVASLKFQSPSTAYASVGANIYKTTDSGATWTFATAGNNIALISSSEAWVSTTNEIRKTSNNWQSFTKQFNYPDFYKNILLPNDECYTLATDRVLRKTNLLQGNCNNVGSGEHICDNFAVKNNQIWTARIVNSNQVIVHTSTNAGSSFTALDTFPFNGNANIADMAFLNASFGIIADNSNGVYITNNGGADWAAYTITGQTSIRALAYIADASDTAVYVVGAGSKIHKSINKGASWTTQTTGQIENLNKVFFLTPNEGWAVGENSLLLKTTNGGTTWSSSNIAAAGIINLYDVHFLSSSQGWAVGDNGFILMSNNGGTSWVAQPNTRLSVLSGDFNQIVMLSATNGYAFGNAGTYKYTALPVAVEQVLSPEQVANISLYPNPVHDQLNILHEGQTSETVFRLLDATGKQVLNGKLNTGNNQINVNELPAGLYFMQIENSPKIYKIIKL